MSIQTFTPGQPLISMTEPAIQHSQSQLSTQKASGLRLSLKESGCSGYMYVLDFVFEPQADDELVKITDDVALFVDKDNLALLQGTQIDYVTEGLNSFFQFKNPNAQGECGCGESFSVEK